MITRNINDEDYICITPEEAELCIIALDIGQEYWDKNALAASDKGHQDMAREEAIKHKKLKEQFNKILEEL